MSLSFSRSVLRIAVAQICQRLGWDAVHSTALELISCIVERYMYNLGQQSHRYAELFGRSQPNLDDLGLAFNEQHINLNDLRDFLKHVESVPFALETLRFPQPSAASVTFCQVREYQNDQKNEDDPEPQIHFEDGCCSPRISVQDSLHALTSPLAGSVPTGAEKRLAGMLSPGDLPVTKKARFLPDEAAHSQYEMKSFVKTDSGVLYPKGQGKLADCHYLHVDSPTTEQTQVSNDFAINRDTLSKLNVSKATKDRTKIRTPALKVSSREYEFPSLPVDYSPKSSNTIAKKGGQSASNLQVQSVIEIDEDFLSEGEEAMDGLDLKARETRLTAYEDAIDSVIRKVQAVDKRELTVVSESQFPQIEEIEITDDVLDSPCDVMKVEREARIADTIDAVIAQASNPLARNMQFDAVVHNNDEDEFIEVHADSPVIVESSPSDTAPQFESISNFSIPPTPIFAYSPAEQIGTSKNKVFAGTIEQIDITENDSYFGKKKKLKKVKRKVSLQHLHRKDGRDSVVTKQGHYLSDPLVVKMTKVEKTKDNVKHKNHGNKNRIFVDNVKNVKHRKSAVLPDDEDVRLPIAAAESLMELAGVVPPSQKRLRISFGSGKHRTVENPVLAESVACDDNATARIFELPVTKSAQQNLMVRSSESPVAKTTQQHLMAKSSELPVAKTTQQHLTAKSSELPVAKTTQQHLITKSSELPVAKTTQQHLITKSSELPVAKTTQQHLTAKSSELPVAKTTTQQYLTAKSSELPVAKTAQQHLTAKSSELPVAKTTQHHQTTRSSELPVAKTTQHHQTTRSSELPVAKTTQHHQTTRSSELLVAKSTQQRDIKDEPSHRQETLRIRRSSESIDPYDIPLMESKDKHPINKTDAKFNKKTSKGQSKKSKHGEPKNKKKSSEKVHSIPKMTIKFGGGSSGGTANSLSVVTSDTVRPTEVATQAPLKLVIRPFAPDLSTSSAKISPHKGAKRHSLQTSNYPCEKPGRTNNISRLSPARFTSSSSSSSSGSPYREFSSGAPRTPTPPALSSQVSLLPTSPLSASYSPSLSHSSRSRSPSPPTLYRSPEINERLLPFGNIASHDSKIISSFSTSQSAAAGVSALSTPLPKKQVSQNTPIAPVIPPSTSKPGPSSQKSSKAKQLVITETVSKIVDETGEITWICPACKMPDDGSPMIGCDICDDWYHWPCVGIVREPPGEEQWFCKRCADSNALSQINKRGKKSQQKNPASASVKLRSKKSSRRK